MIDTKTQQLGTMFEILAEELDVPEHIYKDMVRKYQHLGDWIKLDSKDKFRADAEIYPQGSVNLGTTTPPVIRHRAPRTSSSRSGCVVWPRCSISACSTTWSLPADPS